MTRQMSKGAQVAFANSWLEGRGIEAQTVDTLSHIDGSLSYEENIKNMKRMLGMGGRSEQKAARGLSAAECDVAIGNCDAGFAADCKDACVCGDPDACEVVEQKATPKATSKPKLKTVEDVEQWLSEKYTEYGGEWEFKSSPEYKQIYPRILKIYGERNKQREKMSKQVAIVKNPYGTGYAIQFVSTKNAYAGGGGMMGGLSTFNTVGKAVAEAKRSGYEVLSRPTKTESSNDVKKITNNMPAGYAIHKWSYEDRTGKVTAHAVMFKGNPVAFAGVRHPQNKTFKSLTDARKALKEHLDTERLKEQVKTERAHLAKHGNIGKTGYIKPTAATKPTRDTSVPDVLATPTAGMQDALNTAIAAGFTGKPKRGLVSQKEHELAETIKEWGKGKHTAKPKAKKATAKPKPKAKTATKMNCKYRVDEFEPMSQKWMAKTTMPLQDSLADARKMIAAAVKKRNKEIAKKAGDMRPRAWGADPEYGALRIVKLCNGIETEHCPATKKDVAQYPEYKGIYHRVGALVRNPTTKTRVQWEMPNPVKTVATPKAKAKNATVAPKPKRDIPIPNVLAKPTAGMQTALPTFQRSGAFDATADIGSARKTTKPKAKKPAAKPKPKAKRTVRKVAAKPKASTANVLKGTKLTRIQQKHLKDYGYVNVSHNKKRYRLTPSRVKRGIIQR